VGGRYKKTDASNIRKTFSLNKAIQVGINPVVGLTLGDTEADQGSQIQMFSGLRKTTNMHKEGSLQQ
jgi:hypothetical protein